MSKARVRSSTASGMIRIVCLKEDEHWIAQCLEYDIVAQAKSLPKLHAAFALAFISHIAVREHTGQGLFEGVPKAPKKYYKLFEEGTSLKPESVRFPIQGVPFDAPLEARVSA